MSSKAKNKPYFADASYHYAKTIVKRSEDLNINHERRIRKLQIVAYYRTFGLIGN